MNFHISIFNVTLSSLIATILVLLREVRGVRVGGIYLFIFYQFEISTHDRFLVQVTGRGG